MTVNKKCYQYKLCSLFYIIKWKNGKIWMIFDIQIGLWKSEGHNQALIGQRPSQSFAEFAEKFLNGI